MDATAKTMCEVAMKFRAKWDWKAQVYQTLGMVIDKSKMGMTQLRFSDDVFLFGKTIKILKRLGYVLTDKYDDLFYDDEVINFDVYDLTDCYLHWDFGGATKVL
jgi:hypothetical protein